MGSFINYVMQREGEGVGWASKIVEMTLSTSSLIRPSYTISDTIFGKVYRLEKDQKWNLFLNCFPMKWKECSLVSCYFKLKRKWAKICFYHALDAFLSLVGSTPLFGCHLGLSDFKIIMIKILHSEKELIKWLCL